MIVLLLSKPHALNDTAVRAALGRAFNSDFSTNTDERFVLPVIEGYQYMIKNVDTLFILHSRVVPYFDEPGAVAAAIKGDDALADNVAAHGAWTSLDVLGGDQSTNSNYDMIGAVLAELAPPGRDRNLSSGEGSSDSLR